MKKTTQCGSDFRPVRGYWNGDERVNGFGLPPVPLAPPTIKDQRFLDSSKITWNGTLLN